MSSGYAGKLTAGHHRSAKMLTLWSKVVSFQYKPFPSMSCIMAKTSESANINTPTTTYQRPRTIDNFLVVVRNEYWSISWTRHMPDKQENRTKQIKRMIWSIVNTNCTKNCLIVSRNMERLWNSGRHSTISWRCKLVQ